MTPIHRYDRLSPSGREPNPGVSTEVRAPQSSQNTVTEEHGVGTGGGLLYFTLDAKGDAAPTCYNGNSPRTECYSYDSNGALRQKVTPATTDNYTNDGASRVSTHTDGNGNVTTYFYDALDRVKQISYGSANPPQPCTPSVTCTLLTYDADGNLTTVQDQTGTSTYSQDKLNRLASQTESGSATTTYTLDGAGNLTKIVNGLGSSNPINYHYDPANRLDGLWTGTASSCSGSTCTSFTYDAAGNRKTTAYPNGVSLSMNYDNENHLTSIAGVKSQVTFLSSNYSYAIASDTNMRQYFTDQNNHGYQYTYDAADRLYEAYTNDPQLYPTYYYPADANGNNCGRGDGSACQGNSSDPIRYNAANQMTYNNGISYPSIDANGNTLSWSTSNDHGGFHYNAQNQVDSETHGGTSISYTYRGVGQGDRATANGSFGNQAFTSDSLGMSTETNTATGSPCPCYYVHDTVGTLVEEILTAGPSAGTYYPVFDGDGSVIALTDGSGNVVDTMTYGPSNLIASTGSVYEPWFFQGKYMDQTGGSQSNEAAGNEQFANGQRYLQMGWMATTWNQQDPLDNPFETNGWNRYNYAGGDAVNLSDPNGIAILPGLPDLSPVRTGMRLPETGPLPPAETGPLPPAGPTAPPSSGTWREAGHTSSEWMAEGGGICALLGFVPGLEPIGLGCGIGAVISGGVAIGTE